jgi:hypothetical protein
MSDDYWKKKHLYAKFNRTAEMEAARQQQQATIETQQPPKPPESITFATPQEEIQYLRALAHDIWKLYCDLSLRDQSPDQKPTRAFYAVDRQLRALGILPSKPKKK